MTTSIASTAVIDPHAEIDCDVEIGPFCVIGPDAVIGRGCRLENNVTIQGKVTIGEHNLFCPGVVIGGPPQDLSYQGENTEVTIGDHNVFRECVTVNRATIKEERVTSIGDHCYFMAGAHIAHDCRLGDRIVMANATLLGGHVHIHDDATISGGVGIHQFTTIGSYSFIAGLSRAIQDVPPFMLVEGVPAKTRCVNLVALKRNNFPLETVKALNEAYRLLYRSKVGLDHAREILRSNSLLVPAVNHLLSFVQTQHEGRHGRARERRRAA